MLAKVVQIIEKPTSKGGVYSNVQLDVAGKKITLNSFDSADNATFEQAKQSGVSIEVVTSKNDKGYDQIDGVTMIPGSAPVSKPVEQATQEPAKADNHFKADPERQTSIELQHYTDNIKDLWIAGKIPNDSPLVKKYMEILYRKVGASVELPKVSPEPVQPKTVSPKPVEVVNPPVLRISAATLKQLRDAADEGVRTPDELLVEVARRGWKAKTRDQLSEDQAQQLIKWCKGV
jgi:hypothetical protein